MNWVLFFVIIVMAFSLLFLRKARKGPIRTIEQLQRPIDDLLKRGFDGGNLIIEHTDSEKFIQYSKYIHRKGDYGIELGLPDAEWSRGYYLGLKNYCSLNDIQFREEVKKRENELSFLSIDCKKDTQKAYQLASDILISIFRLTKKDKFYVRLQNASKNDELIMG